MDKKNVLTMIIAGVAVIISIAAIMSRPETVTTIVTNPDGSKTTKTLAAASGPTVINGCMQLEAGGATYCGYTKSFAAASTTCSFRAELASSTLVTATARPMDMQGGNYGVEFGKAANAFSTTTSLGRSQGVIVSQTLFASTSGVVGLSYQSQSPVFSQGEFLNIKVGSTSFTGTGTCSALFMQA